MPTPETIKPYDGERPKATQVEEMFNSIATAYDFMNRAMTLGIDKLWRARAVKMVKKQNPQKLLDVATGTGDLAISLARKLPGAAITGIDLSEKMLAIGRTKVEKAGLAGRITLAKADCLALPFADGEFDCVTVAYGVRNFENLDRGYREMARVLKPGGMLCVIELSVPPYQPYRSIYNFYTRHIILTVGRIVSSDPCAYTYLPRSIAAMPQGGRMLQIMDHAGLTGTTLRRFTFGVCTVYIAFRPEKESGDATLRG